jgi:3-dehydroquinate synthase II
VQLWLSVAGDADNNESRPADMLLCRSGDEVPDWALEDGGPSLLFAADDGSLADAEGQIRGAHVFIDDADGQQEARALVGMVDWILLTCSDWTMIPLENLVAAAEGSPTRIAAAVDELAQLQGAAFALQRGVDALLLPSDDALWAEGERLAAERLAARTGAEERASDLLEQEVLLESMTITSVEVSGLADRVCVDLVQLLEVGEGILVGSSANALCLVHGETLESAFVPPRPFRVNAGPVHAYTLLADGSTRYLCELAAGEEVLVVSPKGCRPVAVGRLKIEQRPMLLLRFITDGGIEGQLFVQQAETVRLVAEDGTAISVTEVEDGMRLLGSTGAAGRHIGQPIEQRVEER